MSYLLLRMSQQEMKWSCECFKKERDAMVLFWVQPLSRLASCFGPEVDHGA